MYLSHTPHTQTDEITPLMATVTTTSLLSLPLLLRSSIPLLSFPSIPPLAAALHRASRSISISASEGPIPAASGIGDESNAGLGGRGDGEGEVRVLTAMRTEYNDIVIADTRESRVLLLDDTGNVHSILYKEREWTDSYWDEFVSLPAIIPGGPIAIFGLGGGTAAHLLLRSWPSLQLYGWELDRVLIDKARDYFGLSDLEKSTDSGLHVKIGDALSSSSNIPGGYAGIIVDLFSGGKVLPQLEKAETWLELSGKLMTNGRIMVNCGGSNRGTSGDVNETHLPEMLIDSGDWMHHNTIKAMHDAFGGQVIWKRMPDNNGANYLALTGSLPDLTSWEVSVPNKLASSVKLWKSCAHGQC